MDTIITSARPSGNVVTVAAGLYCGIPSTQARVNGGPADQTAMVALDTPIVREGVTYTHAIGRIALTTDEAQRITLALAALAQTPEATEARERNAEADALWTRQCEAAEDQAVREDAWRRNDTQTVFGYTGMPLTDGVQAHEARAVAQRMADERAESVWLSLSEDHDGPGEEIKPRDAEHCAIETLRSEAAAAGDMAQVEVCDAALRGDTDAIAECERVIADAAAQQD